MANGGSYTHQDGEWVLKSSQKTQESADKKEVKHNVKNAQKSNPSRD
jgi:hypothetical protein